MADKKISALTAAGTLDGTEEVPVVQGAATVKTTTAAIAALGGGGMTLLAAAAISSPVTSLVLALTGSYSSYKLDCINWKGEGVETPTDTIFLSLEVSVDGGLTFIGTGSENYDEYAKFEMFASADIGDPIGNVQKLTATSIEATLAAYQPSVDAANGGVGVTGTLEVFPGASGQSFMVRSNMHSFPSKPGMFICDSIINPAAIDFDASWLARITHVCVQFYDNEWNDSLINSGYYRFWGIG
jgi:hypothetical protein